MTNTQHVTRVHAYLRLSPHVSHRVGLLAFRSLYFGSSLARRGGPSAGAEERQWNPGPCVVPVAAPPACSVALARKGGGLACGESRAAPGPRALRGPASPLTGWPVLSAQHTGVGSGPALADGQTRRQQVVPSGHRGGWAR